MNPNLMIVFVCEHGAAKSIIAAAYFNQIASEWGVNLRAIARGTNPDPGLSPRTITGLLEVGLAPTESVPQKLTGADMQSVRRVVTFCELPIKYQQHNLVEYWENIPPVSDNYGLARDRIVERIHLLLESLSLR